MKKLLLTACACCLFATQFYAQTKPLACGSDEAKAYFINNLPGYKEQLKIAEQKNAEEFQAFLNRMPEQRTASSALPTYTIPIVFHVLHTNGSENVSDASCIAALAHVNSDYARMGADTANIDPLYEPLYVNSRIRFVLAKKDPYGNCTTGIIHHYDENTKWQQNDLSNYKYTTVGTYNWKSSRYLNVYVVSTIIGDIQAGLGIGGYTYKPGTAPSVGSDAVVLSLGLLLDPSSKGLSHEIGHWLGLSHVFDGNGGFTLATGIGMKCGNDDIADTPKTPGFVSVCPNYLTISDSCDVGHRPNLQNIMDYASCPIMFTQGQTDKMRYSLASSIANRDYLVSNKNLSIVGILNESVASVSVNPVTNKSDTTFTYAAAPTQVCAPIADFYATKAKACQGQVVAFNSTSFNNTTALSYAWQFEGGSPSTSTLTAPSVTYAVPGNYATTLTITNAAGTSSKVRTPFPAISWHVDQSSYPAMEGFETSATLPVGWSITNKDYGTLTWQYGNYGSNSSKCITLPNASSNNGGPGNIDILETGQYNFSNTTSLGISYDYSYARKPGATGDVFTFEYSTDCGGTWVALGSTPSASVMSASGGTVSAPYIPYDQSKWVTKTYLSALLTVLSGKPDVKFRFSFQNTGTGNAQNLYLDNFNISGTVGLQELEHAIGLIIYPNPSSASSTVEFSSPVNAKVNVMVHDVTGRLVEQQAFDAVAGNASRYEVNKNAALKPGAYFISLDINQQKITKKLIIQ